MQTLAPEAALSQSQLVASQNANVYKKKTSAEWDSLIIASPPL